MPVTKVRRTRKKRSPVKRKKSVSKPRTSAAVVNKMEKLLDKNEIRIDDSRYILKKNIDKLVKEINNDPNIPKEKKTRIIFELYDIYSNTDIVLNNPADYSKLNDLYRRFDNVVKQLDDITLRTVEKRRIIYGMGLKTIRYSLTILVIYYFEQLFVYFIGASILLSFPGPAVRFTIEGVSLSKFLYLVFVNMSKIWIECYSKFIFEGLLPLLNDISKMIFRVFGVTFYNILDFAPDLKNWLGYLYNYIVPIEYKNKFN